MTIGRFDSYTPYGSENHKPKINMSKPNQAQIRADINVVKNLISMREKIYRIQNDLQAVHNFLDQTADDFMAHLLENGTLEEKDCTDDSVSDIDG